VGGKQEKKDKPNQEVGKKKNLGPGNAEGVKLKPTEPLNAFKKAFREKGTGAPT